MKKYLPIALSFLLAACGGGSDSDEKENKSNLSVVSESVAGNDYFSSAQAVTVNSLITGSVNTVSDPEDYFSFDVKQGDTLSINLTCLSDVADIDLSLHDSDYGTVLSSIELNCTEEIIYQVPEDMVMYVLVDILEGDSSNYSLAISTNDVDPKDDTGVVIDPGTTLGANPLNNIYEACSQAHVNGVDYYVDTNGTVVGACPGEYDYQCRIEYSEEVNSGFTSYSDIFYTKEFIESTWGHIYPDESFPIEELCKNDASDDMEGTTHTLIIL